MKNFIFLSFCYIILIKFAVSDNCLVKLDDHGPTGSAHFWQICYDNLSLNESKNVCELNKMSLVFFNATTLKKVINDMQQIRQTYLQVKEIGNIYQESLFYELIDQFCHLDKLESNLLSNIKLLSDKQDSYIKSLKQNTTDSEMRNKLDQFKHELDRITNTFEPEVNSKTVETKNQANTTLNNIIRGVESDKNNYINIIQNSEESQIEQYLANYRGNLFNRLLDFKNQVLDLRNKMLDFQNLIRAHMNRCKSYQANNLGLSSSINEKIENFCQEYSESGIFLAQKTYELIEAERNRMDIRLKKAVFGLSKIFNM